MFWQTAYPLCLHARCVCLLRNDSFSSANSMVRLRWRTASSSASKKLELQRSVPCQVRTVPRRGLHIKWGAAILDPILWPEFRAPKLEPNLLYLGPPICRLWDGICWQTMYSSSADTMSLSGSLMQTHCHVVSIAQMFGPSQDSVCQQVCAMPGSTRLAELARKAAGEMRRAVAPRGVPRCCVVCRATLVPSRAMPDNMSLNLRPTLERKFRAEI